MWAVTDRTGVAHAAEVVATAPAPEWIVAVERGRASPAMLAGIRNGMAYLLVDDQVRSVPSSRITYRRLATQAIAAEGVDAVANIEIDFDPSYQELVVHAIDVVRDGVLASRLAAADFKILQRETALERRIYDGSRTVSVFLEDIRVGDIVDYAYSVKGRNPVFGGRDFGTFSLQFGAPVARLHARLFDDPASDIVLGTRNGAAAPVTASHRGLRSRHWLLDGVPARVPDTDEPGWFNPEPAVQWGVFADWSAVARWAAPLYAVPKDVAPALRAEIGRIAAEQPTPAGRLLAALRFVQGEIRYLGIAIGTGSHAPSSPVRTLERRFGDCKDKTLLLLALLDGLGIEARAALVDTRIRRGLRDRFASPGQFDHVLVRAVIDGRVYWLDPTRATQRADLEHVVQADFDLALTIDPGTRGLESMRSDHAAASRKTVRVTIDAREGLDRPVAYTVVTEAEGSPADQLRAELAASNLEEIGKRYQNFYAGYHPGIAMVAPLAVEDDTAANRLAITERYRIDEFAEAGEGERRRVASIWTPDLAQWLRAPSSAVRDAPLRIVHPTDLTVITRVLLDEDWPIEDSRSEVEGEAFTLHREITYAASTLTLTYSFHTRTDEVAAAATPRHASQLARAREISGYELSWQMPVGTDAHAGFFDRVNWTLGGFGVMVAVGCVVVARRLYRYDPAPRGPVAPGAPVGLAGWLVLPTLGVILAPLRQAWSTWSDIGGLSADHWAALTTFGAEGYHALWAPLLMFALAVEIATIVLWVTVAIVFLHRRTSAPNLYILAMLLVLSADFVMLAVAPWLPALEMGPAEYASTARNVMSFVLWSAYFRFSMRVRATFTRRLRGRAGETLPPVPGTTAPLVS